MLHDLISWAAGLRGALYVLAFALAAGESAILLDLVVPGETGMVLVGAAGRAADLHLAVLVGAASAGVVAGDLFGYVVGKRWGSALVQRWRITRRYVAPKLDRAERFVERHGGRAVFAARWVGALRAMVPPVAGSSALPTRAFIAWSVPSAVLWTSVMLSIGWFAGSHVADLVDRVGGAISLGAIVVLIVVVRRARRPAAAEVPGSVTGSADEQGDRSEMSRTPLAPPTGFEPVPPP